MTDVSPPSSRTIKKKTPAVQEPVDSKATREPWGVSDKSESASEVPEIPEDVNTEDIRGKHEDPSYENIAGHAETGYPPEGEEGGVGVAESDSQAPVELDDQEGEDVLAAGTINEKGEVVDDEGNVIGHIEGDFDKSIGGSVVDQEGDVLDSEGNVVAKAGPLDTEKATDAIDEQALPDEKIEDIKEDLPEDVQSEAPSTIRSMLPSLLEKVPGLSSKLPSEAIPEDLKSEIPKSPVDSAKDLGEDAEGNIPEAGDLTGEAGEAVEGAEGEAGEAVEGAEGAVDETASKLDEAAPEGELPEGEIPEGAVPEGEAGEAVEGAEGALDEAGEAVEGAEEGAVLPDISILEGLTVNKAGNIVDETGKPLGKLVEGDPKKLAGKKVDKEGKIWNDSGKVIGVAEVLPEANEEESKPFESFPDAKVDSKGLVIYEGQQVGVVIEGDIAKLVGKTVDEDGDILDKHGNTIGKAERKDAEEPVEPEAEPEVPIDYSILKDKKVNKAGNVVDDKGQVFGRVIEGILKLLINRRVDENGDIWNDNGKKIGKAEPLAEEDREEAREPAPFEDFENALVEKDGFVRSEGVVIGKVIEGDAKKLAGKKVDPDGDIVDKNGNVLGKAERYEEEEPEPEAEVVIDNSALAGKRVNKAGNVVDSHGDIYGRLVEGDVKRLAGKMCDKFGFVRNEGGDVIGKAELVPDAEREGLKEGPFADFAGCTVAKDGKIVTSTGEVVGRLIEGDARRLFGRIVDEDGDVLDKNGNTLGKAERWEEPEEEKEVNPMSGRRVNKAGEVVDENGDVIGKLTEGDLQHCIGKKIDDDGDVVDGKGSSVGHVTLLEYIPEPEAPTENPEDVAAREQLEKDRKLAGQIAYCIEGSLDKIKPILNMITRHIDKADRTPKEELDEEELVKQVKPLIEEGGKILTEANGVIRGLDPDGRISAQAKHKTASREASPEEFRLAELLKELAGSVTETIENAKRKIEDMPHAKKELNPLWGLLAEPLGQILAAVGLLLSGVLGLVGRLLSVLGLGGLLDNLLGSLGLKGVLQGLGLGSLTDSLTGKKGGKKSGGGLLG